MRLLIKGRNFEVSGALRDHATRRLRLALGRFGDEVDQVTATFSGVSPELRCRIDVRLKPTRTHTDEVDADAFAATDRATDRATRAVARALDRDP